MSRFYWEHLRQKTPKYFEYSEKLEFMVQKWCKQYRFCVVVVLNLGLRFNLTNNELVNLHPTQVLAKVWAKVYFNSLVNL